GDVDELEPVAEPLQPFEHRAADIAGPKQCEPRSCRSGARAATEKLAAMAAPTGRSRRKRRSYRWGHRAASAGVVATACARSSAAAMSATRSPECSMPTDRRSR